MDHSVEIVLGIKMMVGCAIMVRDINLYICALSLKDVARPNLQ